ncbi:MAG TPA: hypothetical protein VNY78_08935 [Edaphobacter sp.]|jgi:hypothetical protein|nr:hypothetical protein [Edaphobacter sp.]
MANLLDARSNIHIQDNVRCLNAIFPSRLLLRGIGAAALFLFVAYKVIQTAPNISLAELDQLTVVVGFVLLVPSIWICWIWLLVAGGDHETLTIGATGLSVERIVFGRVWKTCTFRLKDVNNLRFAQTGFGPYGSVFGLRFEHLGKKHKIFKGMKQTDADLLIERLKSLGINCRNRD